MREESSPVEYGVDITPPAIAKEVIALPNLTSS